MTRRLVCTFLAGILIGCSDSNKSSSPTPGTEPLPGPVMGCELERQLVQIRQEFLNEKLVALLQATSGDQKLVLGSALLFQYLEKNAFIKPSTQKYEDLNDFYFNIFKPDGMPRSGLPENLCQ